VRPLIHTSGTKVEPRTALEGRIAEVWRDVFGVPAVSVEDDFFVDLGGHSLTAARMVTRLRERVPHEVAVRDVYDCPSVRALANRLESRPRDEAGDSAGSPLGRRVRSARAVFDSVPRRRRVLTIGLQALSLYVLSAVPAIPLEILLLVLVRWFQSDVPTTTLVVVWVAVALLSWPVMLVVSIAAKWLLIGRYRSGDHPLWGSYYFRWWLCDRLQAFSGAGALAGTPLLPLYFRLMGSRVGARCTLDTALRGTSSRSERTPASGRTRSCPATGSRMGCCGSARSTSAADVSSVSTLRSVWASGWARAPAWTTSHCCPMGT
jgi:acyl carrier protein